jgi:sulfite reductase (ferredoxin)
VSPSFTVVIPTYNRASDLARTLASLRGLETGVELDVVVVDDGSTDDTATVVEEHTDLALTYLRQPNRGPSAARNAGLHAATGDMVTFLDTADVVDPDWLATFADLADAYGDGRVRTTVEQKLVILGVPAERVDALVAELEARDLAVTPSAFRRGTIACTGIQFCKLAIVETKARSQWLYDELERRLPEFDTPVTINLNGCPNSCARFQTADIGLKGSVVDGQEGFQVHLGGALGADSGFGRKVRGLKVTAEQLPDFVEQLLVAYRDDREDGESFATWVRHADESQLRWPDLSRPRADEGAA